MKTRKDRGRRSSLFVIVCVRLLCCVSKVPRERYFLLVALRHCRRSHAAKMLSFAKNAINDSCPEPATDRNDAVGRWCIGKAYFVIFACFLRYRDADETLKNKWGTIKHMIPFELVFWKYGRILQLWSTPCQSKLVTVTSFFYEWDIWVYRSKLVKFYMRTPTFPNLPFENKSWRFQSCSEFFFIRLQFFHVFLFFLPIFHY